MIIIIPSFSSYLPHICSLLDDLEETNKMKGKYKDREAVFCYWLCTIVTFYLALLGCSGKLGRYFFSIL